MCLLQYDRRSYAVGQIAVGTSMRGGTQRYGNASCPLDINVISCKSHVQPARLVTFVSSGRRSVSRPEKHIFPCDVRRVRQPVSCLVGSTGNCIIGGLPDKPVVNTTILTCARISCCCSCIQSFLLLFLYAAFKSSKMLSVHRFCKSRS
jgi:hypothetical protein